MTILDLLLENSFQTIQGRFMLVKNHMEMTSSIVFGLKQKSSMRRDSLCFLNNCFDTAREICKLDFLFLTNTTSRETFFTLKLQSLCKFLF